MTVRTQGPKSREKDGSRGNLVLRKIGELSLLICPRRAYGDNVFALNQAAAEIFKCWSHGLTTDESVTKLEMSFALPLGFSSHVDMCMEAFNKLAHGEKSTLFGPPSGNVSDFGTDKSFWDERIPVYGGIEPTWRCNLNCCHCYIRNPTKTELTIDEWKAILDQLASAGCLHLAITGGEPLFYDKFSELYRYAALSGFLITVFTNGTLITEPVAALFNEFPPRRLEISMYGATEDTYESVTRVKGSYKLFMQGIKHLSQYHERVPVILKSVLLRENVHERLLVQKFAFEHGFPMAQNSLIRPRLDGIEGPETHRLSPSEVAITELEIKSEYDAWDEFAVSSTPISRQTDIIECSAGNIAFQVDFLGRIGYCVIARMPSIDLKTVPMNVAWQQMGEERSKYFQKPKECIACTDSKFCDFCPGYLQKENELPDSSDGDQSYHCAVARGRHERFQQKKLQKEVT